VTNPEEPSQDETRSTRSRVLERVLDSPRWKIAVGGAPFLTAAIAAAGIYVQAQLADDEPAKGEAPRAVSVATTTPAAATAIPAPATASPPIATTSAREAVIAAGTCLSSALQVVPCERQHAHEVVNIGDCDEAALVEYLGGEPGLDVVFLSTSTLDIPGAAAAVCVVSDQEGLASVTSVQDVLMTERGSAFRWCLDQRQTDVPCSEPHVAEIVGAADADLEAEPDCKAAAETYMSTVYERVAQDLRVFADRRTDGIRCVVAARGRNLLTRSLRDLDVAPVPLVADALSP
jgi:hypothetical protein